MAAGKLSDLATDRERSKIDANEADPVDECRYLGLRCVVVAGREQHAPSAVGPRIFRQYLCAKVIERLNAGFQSCVSVTRFVAALDAIDVCFWQLALRPSFAQSRQALTAVSALRNQ